MVRAVSNTQETQASAHLQALKNEALVKVTKEGYALESLSANFQDDEDVVEVAMGQNPFAFQFASKRLKDNNNMAIFAVNKQGLLLQYLSETLQDDESIVQLAITQNRYALMYASPRLQEKLKLN
jgi:hypothetical protein